MEHDKIIVVNPYCIIRVETNLKNNFKIEFDRFFFSFFAEVDHFVWHYRAFNYSRTLLLFVQNYGIHEISTINSGSYCLIFNIQLD